MNILAINAETNPPITEIMVSKSRFSEISHHKQEQTLDKCRILTNSVYDGLDLKHEIVSVNNQDLGDTILLYRSNNNNIALSYRS